MITRDTEIIRSVQYAWLAMRLMLITNTNDDIQRTKCSDFKFYF